MIFIPQAKAGARQQPITKQLAIFLQSYMDMAGKVQEWLFPAIAAKSGHVMNIEKPWKRVVLKAGLDPNIVVRAHLSHTAITHLVQAGVDLPTVKRISGQNHANG